MRIILAPLTLQLYSITQKNNLQDLSSFSEEDQFIIPLFHPFVLVQNTLVEHSVKLALKFQIRDFDSFATLNHYRWNHNKKYQIVKEFHTTWRPEDDPL